MPKELALERASDFMEAVDCSKTLRVTYPPFLEHGAENNPSQRTWSFQYCEVRAGIDIHNAIYLASVDARSGQVLEFIRGSDIKPDPDLRSNYSEAQIRAAMIAEMASTEPIFEDSLRLIHELAGNSAASYPQIAAHFPRGVWNGQLAAKHAALQATLTWRGVYRRWNGRRVEISIDARDGTVYYVHEAGGGFGATLKSAPFSWNLGPEEMTVMGKKGEIKVKDARVELSQLVPSPNRVPVTIKVGRLIIRAEYDRENHLLVTVGPGRQVGKPTRGLRQAILKYLR
jgi:hypothetical protein